MVTLPHIALLLASTSLVAAKIHDKDFDEEHVITRDVAVVGGGASGSHAAVRLREDFGKSIVLIEKKGRLGGHTETYMDPRTGLPYDYGVYSYIDFAEQSKGFFKRFDIGIRDLVRTSHETAYVDFKTGNVAKDYVPTPFPDVLAALDKYQKVCQQYEHFLLPSYAQFPEPDDIPEDLLMPFGQFVKKYEIEAAVNQIFEVTGLGVGSMLETPTMHVMQTFGGPLARSFTTGPETFQPVSLNNSELYGKIADLLSDDIMYLSEVVEAERKSCGVKLVVEGYNGERTLVRAKKLLIAFEPTMDAMRPFALDKQEEGVFSKWQHTREYVGIVQHPSLPFNTSVVNTPDSAQGMDFLSLPDPPVQPRFDYMPGSEDLFSFIVVMGQDSSTQDAVELVGQNFKNMVEAGTFPAPAQDASMVPSIVAFGDHGPTHLHASNEEMKNGFIQKQYALQGHRGTWYTGAAWVAHFTTVVWEFTETILPDLLEDL